ncbi:MAG TPA: hypothetical protein VE983_03455, partial [Solirubrobacteraceae bacterium]|nr:hypothetical protein [Solirubrobacteraceae bacterium]
MFVGWGTEPDFSEYNSSGQQIMTGSFPLGQTSYRAFRFTWTGQPLRRPAMALASKPDGRVRVWASWNGATDVSAWRVLGGPSATHLGWLDKKPYSSFETQLTLHNQPAYFAVQALGPHKQVLGTSRAQALPRHVNVFGPAAFVARSGHGAVPVGCFTGSSCHLTVRVTSGKSVLAQTSPESLASGRGGLVGFQLSAQGIRELDQAPHHRLPVLVTARDASGATAGTQLDLIPYAVNGQGPSRSLSESPTIQIVGTAQFVSPAGVATVLAACYAGRPCRVRGRITASGRTIGRLSSGRLGIDELGFVYIKLDRAGRSMLSGSGDNQLAAKVKLTAGHHTAVGHVALVRYR